MSISRRIAKALTEDANKWNYFGSELAQDIFSDLSSQPGDEVKVSTGITSPTHFNYILRDVIRGASKKMQVPFDVASKHIRGNSETGEITADGFFLRTPEEDALDVEGWNNKDWFSESSAGREDRMRGELASNLSFLSQKTKFSEREREAYSAGFIAGWNSASQVPVA